MTSDFCDPLSAVQFWSHHATTSKAKRDEAIIAAREGATLRAIADAAGLTPSGVAKILVNSVDNGDE